MTGPITVDVNTAHTVARVTIPIEGNGTDATSRRRSHTLRDERPAGTVGKVPGDLRGHRRHRRLGDENALLKIARRSCSASCSRSRSCCCWSRSARS